MKKKISTAILILLIIVTTCVLAACDKPEGVSIAKDVNYEMTIDFDVEGKGISSVCEISYKHSGDKAGNIALLMNSATFADTMPVEKILQKDAYPMGESFGKVDIGNVKVNGREAAGKIDGNVLNVKPAKAIKQNDKVVVVVEYSLKLPYNHLRYGYNSAAMQLANFYPQLARIEEYHAVGDPFYSSADDYSVTINYPAHYKLLASGQQTNRTVEGNVAKEVYSAENIRDYAIVLGLTGNIATKSAGGYTVNYLYSADNNFMASLDTALNALVVYSSAYGDYGKKVLNMAEVPFAYGGMEYGDFIIINNQIKDTLMREQVVLHEVAHQWWYGIVGSDQVNHAWQDEGLAEFSVYYYYLANDQTVKANNFLWAVDRSMKNYHKVANSFNIPIDERMDRHLSDFLGNDEYVYNSYDKGFSVYECIYKLMGRDKFLAMIKDYVKTYRDKNVSSQDMFGVMNKHHAGISSVVQAWLDGIVVKS